MTTQEQIQINIKLETFLSESTIDPQGTLIKYNGKEPNVILPKRVKSIGMGAFIGCKFLKTIKFHEHIYGIADWAFLGCSGLVSLTIPDSVTTIGNEAFKDCTALREVSVIAACRIADNALPTGCRLTRRTPSGNTTTIIGQPSTPPPQPVSTPQPIPTPQPAPRPTPQPTPRSSNSADFVIDANGVLQKYLGHDEYVVIPAGVTEIGESVFNKNKTIKSVVIPRGVTTIGREAFYYCSALTHVTLPEGLKKIGYSAFELSSLLTGVQIPATVTEIGDFAFSASPNALTGDLVLPYGIMSIGVSAFKHCKITSVTLPATITHVGINPFIYCSELARIDMTGNDKYRAAGNCLINQSAKTVVSGCRTSIIPTDGSVTRIDNDAFWGITGLQTIHIPNSVTSIGSHAFYDCEQLKTLTIPASVTSIAYYAFSNCKQLKTIHIPLACKVDPTAFDGTNCQITYY